MYVPFREMWPTADRDRANSNQNGLIDHPCKGKGCAYFFVDSKIYPDPHTPIPQRANIQMAVTPALQPLFSHTTLRPQVSRGSCREN